MSPSNPKLAKLPDSALQEAMYGARLASRPRRLAASLLDGCLAMAVVVPFQIVRGVYANFPHMPKPSLMDQLAGTGIGILAWSAFNAFLLQYHGQTIGKRLLSIRIRRIDGQSASLARLIVVRYALFVALGLIPLIGWWLAFLDAIWIFRADRRCIHDLLAGTVVLEARTEATAGSRLSGDQAVREPERTSASDVEDAS